MKKTTITEVITEFKGEITFDEILEIVLKKNPEIPKDKLIDTILTTTSGCADTIEPKYPLEFSLTIKEKSVKEE